METTENQSQSGTERTIWLIAVAVLLVGCLYLYFRLFEAKRNVEQLSEDLLDTQFELARENQNNQALVTQVRTLDSLLINQEDTDDEMRYLKNRLAVLQPEADRYKSLYLRQKPVLTQQERDDLKAKGIADPYETIKDSLQAHPELIPLQSVLGGKFGFYDRSRIWVLGPDRIFAVVEDGHIEGIVLLEYDITDSGDIIFKILESAKEDG